MKKQLGGGTASVFAVVTAFAASACCVGPAILLALGVGGLGFASFMEPYRPYFLALTALFLGGAFYLAYRPLPVETCSADAHCAPSSRRRLRATVWIASAVVVLAASYPYFAGAQAEVPIDTAGIKTVSLDIVGMTCGACANHIRTELERVEGVQGALVRYPEGDARVELASDSVSVESLLEAVERAGYSASVPSENRLQIEGVRQ